MSSLKLAKSITILGDGKLSIFLFDNTEVYLQPTIIVDTLDSLQRLKIRDSVNYVDIETSIEIINGVPFSGNFEQLEISVRETAKNANNIFNSSIPIEYTFVSSLSNLPPAVGGVITLIENYTYFFTKNVDLLGSRFVCENNVAILGTSSENAKITSTGLGIGVPLITSVYTLVVRHVTFEDVDTCFALDGLGNAMALDWTGVNFENIPNVGTIQNFDNFIFNKGSMLNSKGLIFDGTCDTISITDSLLSGDGLAGALIEIPATATINRRFRIIYSAVVVFGSTIGLDIDLNVLIQNESYILDTVNFSGGGTYLAGLDYTSNKSLFVNCKPITNTSVTGQVYMRNNATVTPISVASTFYKVLGTTLDSLDNSKVITSDNRIEIDAAIERKYRIDCTLSFNSANNKVCSFGFYDSFLGAIRQPSIQSATSNAAGRAENVTLFCFANRNQLDYFEVWCANQTNTDNITVTDMNFSVTEIK